MNYLPEKLLKLRKHYNYSQRFVADILGIDVIEYMGFENGRSVINFAQAKQLAKFYHISVTELFLNTSNITLYDISNTHTDEVNIEYFLPSKSKKDKLLAWFKQYKYYVCGFSAVALIIIFVMLFVPNESISNLSLKLRSSNRLDASKTSVVYIDNKGVVKGSGDNSNGQLNLDFDNIVKVGEGSTFTVVLDKEGNLDSTGLVDTYAKEIRKWKNIVDFDCGDGHIIALDNNGEVFCTGDTTFGQCQVRGKKTVKRVFATDTGSIILNEDGTLTSSGDFFGKSSLKNHRDIIDIASSDTLLVLLNANGKVEYYSSGRDYKDAPFFENITDIACGSDFIAGLDSDGNVHIDIDNYILAEEVEKWQDIIAIASGSDYLVAYDGSSISGVGKNTYKQFDSNTPTTRYLLPQVRNVKTSIDQNYVTIQFDEVPNAKAYLVEVDIGTGFSAYVEDPICLIEISRFEEGRNYKIAITALGDGNYDDSSPIESEFTYHAFKTSDSNGDSEDEIDIVEIPFALDKLVGKTKTNFEIYLNGLGIKSEQLEGIQSDNRCSGSEAIIETVEGISDYEVVTKKALVDRKIKYTYCKVEE